MGIPWWATVHGVTKSRTLLKRFSTHTHATTHTLHPALNGTVLYCIFFMFLS